MPKSDFPDEYLLGLEENHRKKVESSLDPAERLLMYSGSRLNSVGEYINDVSVHWTLEHVSVDSLTLTGTSPEWNAITQDRAERNPAKLRKLLQDPKINDIFKNAKYVDIPILVRKEEEGLLILDGMHRTIAAIRDNIPAINTYVGERKGNPVILVEPHVLYDLIKAFQHRGGNEEDFKGSLRFLINTYANAGELLKTRFNKQWLDDDKVQQIIREVLGE